MSNGNGFNNFMIGLEMMEIFSKQYRKRNKIKKWTGYSEDEYFWALREIERQKREAVENGEPPEYDFSKENVGFTKTKPIPYDTVFVYVANHIGKIVETKLSVLEKIGKPLWEPKNTGDGESL